MEVTSWRVILPPFLLLPSSLEQTSISNKVGYPASMLYVVRTDGVDPATGRRIFINANGDEVYFNNADAVKYKYEDGKNSSYSRGERCRGL